MADSSAPARVADNGNPTELSAEQLARGLIPGAERLFECEPCERCTDISEDVARDALGLALQRFEPLDSELLNFLERHLGCQLVAEARRELCRMKRCVPPGREVMALGAI